MKLKIVVLSKEFPQTLVEAPLFKGGMFHSDFED